MDYSGIFNSGLPNFQQSIIRKLSGKADSDANLPSALSTLGRFGLTF